MAGVQCPYTASNCPLFNPIFSEADVLAARSPRPSSPQSRFETNQLEGTTSSGSAYERTTAPAIDRYDQVTLPPLSSISIATLNRTPILDASLPRTSVSYTDYSLAPSNEDTASLPYKFFSPLTSSSVSSNRNPSPLSVQNSSNCDNSSCGPSLSSTTTPSIEKKVPSESSCAAAHQALQRRQLEQQQQQGLSRPGVPQRQSSSSSTERDMEDLLGIYSMEFTSGFNGNTLGGGQSRGLQQGTASLSTSMSPPESFSGGSGASTGDGELGESHDLGAADEEYKPSGQVRRTLAGNRGRGRRSSGSGSGEEIGSGGGGGTIAGQHGGGANGAAQEVTPFISKLSHLLSHNEYADFIRWNTEGDAFIFAHTSPALLEIFARFFRHANVHSFVRQLNIYGFTRLSTLSLLSAIDSSSPFSRPSTSHSQNQTTSTPNLSASDFSGFSHPAFFRDSPPGEVGGRKCELEKIKPKITARKGNPGSSVRGRPTKRKSGAVVDEEDGEDPVGLGLGLGVGAEEGRQRRRTGS